MGQHWQVVNLDKKECLHPRDFDEGLKFLEFAPGGHVMHALATLLAAPESMGAGGGDAKRTEWTGRWAGDRVVIVGDYTDSGPFAGIYGQFARIVPKINFDE
jgi:hypothetical protein